MSVDFVDKQLMQEQQVVSIIGDVPLISVGIMAFGSYTFLTAMRRASLPYSILFVASFLIFSAAILDLSKVLAEVKNAGIITDTGQRLAVVRDVGLALSVGLIYLFMWLFVAERPQVELQQLSVQGQHSGSWGRWGLFGEMLKWLSLTLCLVTPPLRIAWHQLNSVLERDSLLIADATLEVVLSAMFIFKLVLNTFLGRHNMHWIALRDYLLPIFAMAVSAALAIGNLAIVSTQENTQAFTDATIGQFLLSIELYILLLFALINPFYQDIKSAVPPVHREQASSIVGVREQEVFGINGGGGRSMVSSWIGPRREQSISQWDPGLPQSVINRVPGQGLIERADAVVPEGGSPLFSSVFERSPVSALAYYACSPINSKPLPKLPDSEDDHLRDTEDSFSNYRETLERTMSKLRATSPRSIKPDAMGSPHRQRRVSSTSNRALAFASASDLSLSSFPAPPPSAVRPHSPQSLIAQWTTRKSRRKMVYFPPSENLQDDLLVVPHDTSTRHESAGTQYDVTSFIDDLTTPKRSSSVYRVSDSPLPAGSGGRGSHSESGGHMKMRPRPPPIKVPGA